jgi:hypothetical protein
MDNRLLLLQAQIEPYLHQIAALLPEPYRLTLIARHREIEQAEIVMTVDDLSRVADVLARHLPTPQGGQQG